MQHIAPTLKFRERDLRTASPIFSAIAIHDHFSSGIRAREALLWLKHCLCSDMQVRSSLWSFQSLERSDPRTVSLREASKADVTESRRSNQFRFDLPGGNQGIQVLFVGRNEGDVSRGCGGFRSGRWRGRGGK